MDSLRKGVYVKWRDSQTADGWEKISSIGDESLYVESVGFIVHANDDSLTIAHSVSNDSANGRLVIPRECITEFIWLS